MRRRIIWSYFLFPGVLSFLGFIVSRSAGLNSIKPFLPNAVALLIGVFLIWIRIGAQLWIHAKILGWVFVLILCFTLLAPGIQSVHRWISFGPIALNVAMSFTPIVLLAMANEKFLSCLGMQGVYSLILVCQPDASQATAFNVSALVFYYFRKDSNPSKKFIVFLFSLGVVFLSWLRPDPLPAVNHVESVFKLAMDQGVLVGISCISFVIFLFGPILKSWSDSIQNSKTRALACALFLYWLISFLAPFLGNFPVPILGAGASPVLGWFLTVAILLGRPDAGDVTADTRIK